MFDQLEGASTAYGDVARRWFSGFFTEKLLTQRGSSGRLSVPFYYDPELDHVQSLGSGVGLGIAWYILPYQDRLAKRLFDAAAQDMGLYEAEYDPRDWARHYVPGVALYQLALCLALEFGEDLVARRVRSVLEIVADPREFGDGAFGFFYHFDDEWPRGQLSALLMVAEVLEAGAWQRAFSNPSYAARFKAPSVVGVDFPTLGVSQAWNDAEEGTLTVSTYAATPSARGQPASFQVVNCPAASTTQITCDGAGFDDWRLVDGSTIEIRTAVGPHTFVITTGYKGPTGVGAGVQDSRL